MSFAKNKKVCAVPAYFLTESPRPCPPASRFLPTPANACQRLPTPANACQLNPCNVITLRAPIGGATFSRYRAAWRNPNAFESGLSYARRASGQIRAEKNNGRTSCRIAYVDERFFRQLLTRARRGEVRRVRRYRRF
jgi:hypothetical protein